MIEVISLLISMISICISSGITIYQWNQNEKSRDLQQETLILRKQLLEKAVNDEKHKKKVKEMKELMREIREVQKNQAASREQSETYSDKLKKIMILNDEE